MPPAVNPAVNPADNDAAPVGLALLGLGVVGLGVYQAIRERADTYAQRTGRPLAIRHIAVRDTARPRSVPIDPALLSDDPRAIATAPDVSVVLEVMGGEQPATDCIRAALHAGKHVVTANKEVMAKHGPELLDLAHERRVELRFEASVGGGIPILAALKRDLQANDIQRLQAIINGTTNFILTAMANDGASYETALAEAQRRGYAEADPTADVDGIDAAYKTAILASLAFHTFVHPDHVYREGIRHLTPRDFRHAANLGYVIKLLATAARRDDTLDVRVHPPHKPPPHPPPPGDRGRHPALIPAHDPLARVDGVLNAVAVEGDLLGRAIFEGEGAGANPTASAVVADLLDIVYGLAAQQHPRPLRPIDRTLAIQPIGERRMRYYLRVLVQDQPGTLADLGRLFADHHISIASLLQVEADAIAGTAEIIITTHEALEADLDRFLTDLHAAEFAPQLGVRIRMEGPTA
jgi:homoserine dehydrogenase